MSPATRVSIRFVEPGSEGLLAHVAEGVFDHPIRAEWLESVVAAPRHHLVVAVEDGVAVGMASAIGYLHPDKPMELWINEIGVAPTHRRRGLGRRLLDALVERGRADGCVSAWVIADDDNDPALALYGSAGFARQPHPQVLFELELGSPGPRSR